MPDSTSKALPLTKATFLIMLSLLPEARHGYAIMKEVRSLSEGRIRMSTGTLYGALKRLLEQNRVEQIVKSDGNQEETRPGRPRRVYMLTELGRRVLQAEALRLVPVVGGDGQSFPGFATDVLHHRGSADCSAVGSNYAAYPPCFASELRSVASLDLLGFLVTF